MFKKTKVLFLYTETPLHVGSGSSLGVVDLPIQRERHTNFPMVQASGLKGSLRDYARQHSKDDSKINLVFGPDSKGGSEHAGAIAFTDAKLLLFPVRSLKGIFAWVTCPSVLQRFMRDMTVAGLNPTLTIPSVGDNEALITNSSEVVVDNKVVLEEFSFSAKKTNEAEAVAKWISENAIPQSSEYGFWKGKIGKNLAILPDNAFRDFTEFSTEVIARTKIDNTTKTVATGALWYEEHLPSDTLLYSLALATDVLGNGDKKNADFSTAEHVLKFITDLEIDRFQLGGDETVGRGIVKLQIAGGNHGGK
ncbi:MAG: type III-B CRISPR module RAMP protein Cmr4 [Deltaproteobacteria bacterium]